jgi:hypothetical protein
MQQYKRHLNKTVNQVAKTSVNNIRNEVVDLFYRPDIPSVEKRYVYNKLEHKLTPHKRKQLNRFLFGNTTSVPATTTSVPTATTSIPATTTTTASVSAPVVSVPAASVSAPLAAVSVPATSIAMPGVTGTVVQPQSYNQIAAAVKQLEGAASNLLTTAAGQNITG